MGKQVTRFRNMVRTRVALKSSWDKKMELKNKMDAKKAIIEEHKAEKIRLLEEKRKRTEENKKRREENARKAEIVQEITNIGKLKRKSKKELRKLRHLRESLEKQKTQ